jgi:hypothetical protein
MEAAEKREMLELLERGRVELLQAVEGVSEQAAALPPSPQSWSILQCVEHVAVAEAHLLGQIESAQPAAAPMRNENREAAIRVRGADRTRKVSAPVGAEPRGRFPSLDAALQYFLATRGRTIQFVDDCSADLRSRLTTHPLIGAVNCYETLLMMAAHPARHARQIAEIRSALDTR